MAKAIIMPQVGQDIETGAIIEWRVRENDYINKGDIVAVVESDKATFEVEAYESGVLLKILHEAGAEVKVLDPIAYVGEPGEQIAEAADAAADAGDARVLTHAKSKTDTGQAAGTGASPGRQEVGPALRTHRRGSPAAGCRAARR